MKNKNSSFSKSFLIIKNEWFIFIPLAILNLFLSVFNSGFKFSNLDQALKIPLIYAGDGLAYTWIAKRAVEGSIYINARNGYPFGSNFYDYPNPEIGSIAILKILGLLNFDAIAAVNLYFFLGYVAVSIATYITLRLINVNKFLSFSGSIIYAFIPFHYFRIYHLFYTWYFIVPVVFLLAYLLSNKDDFNFNFNFKNALIISLLGSLLSCFGIYYNVFSLIIILISWAFGYIKYKNIDKLLLGLFLILSITFTTFLSLYPSIKNNYVNGKNKEAAQRMPAESEVYGLKITQLLLPIDNHRINKVGAFKNSYNQSFPLVNENSTASLGFYGALGLILCFLSTFLIYAGKDIDIRIRFFSMLTIGLILICTIGGLSSLFSLTISPMIRGWNRASIFIGFACISIFLLTLQNLIDRFGASKKLYVYLLITPLLSISSFLDQTPTPCRECILKTKEIFTSDKKFISSIESALPKYSTIYTLPYIQFPESPPLNQLGPYDNLIGFINSKHLYWSYGGVKGREGDLFYRNLSKETLSTQVETAKKMGFNGIYVDLRGFSAKANVQDELNKLISPPLFKSDDGNKIFYKF